VKTIAIIILGLILLSASCKKNKKCSRGYELEHPVTVSPIKESYNIGDTIWFEMNFSDVFNALVTNNYDGSTHYENIRLQNFDFHRNFLCIFKLLDNLVNVTGQPKGQWDDSFDPVYLTGQIIQELPDGPEYKLKYQSGSYQLKIGMILKQSGIYLYNPIFINKYPASSFGANEQDITLECETEIITDIRFPVNKQTNGTYLTNYHLFEQFMNPSLENDIERIKTQTFTFVVIE